MSKCPHDNIVHCPLYVASHSGHDVVLGHGCVNGDWAQGCEIERGDAAYIHAVAKLAKIVPRLVQGCADREAEALAKAQRQRSMRAAGLH